MKRNSQGIYLLGEAEKESGYRWKSVSETILTLLLLSGVLFALQDLMDSRICVAAAFLTGGLAVMILQLSARARKAYGLVRTAIYITGILAFFVFIVYTASGFLTSVNRLIVLWNMRFGTEGRTFSVAGNPGLGSLIFWALLSLPLSVSLLALVRRKNTGAVIAAAVGALLFGFVIGRSEMWEAVFLLTGAILCIFMFSNTPFRRVRLQGVLCLMPAAALVGGVLLATAGYEGSSGIEEWKRDVSDWIDKFRYGEDTLPRGDLEKAPGLLEGERETLVIGMDQPQELYLKGFVGGSYDGKEWKALSKASYQGEFEGILDWLEEQQFLPVAQYADYYRLTQEASGVEPEYAEVQVDNTGAYRKFAYLPAAAENWSGRGLAANKDWQVQSVSFFGVQNYRFRTAAEAPAADEAVPAQWLGNGVEEDQRQYLEAEAVYHSFVEEYYLEVGEELRAVIQEMFFRDGQDMDFQELTSHIRTVLRKEAIYTETPDRTPAGEDFIQWFLKDSKAGNAVYYASAAVMAYREAGYPARYVEGYHYTEEDAEALRESGEHTAHLTSENAHAWVEVYVSGIGWLPVEVVPGMYAETYSSQMVEGKPVYQVSSQQDDHGLELEDGGQEGANEEQDGQQAPEAAPGIAPAVVLACLYLCFILYLILELQRAVRITVRRKKGEQVNGVYAADLCAVNVWKLLRIGGVTGNYNHPAELAGKVAESFPGIRAREYERAILLIQKVRFGGKKLRASETYTLECFLNRLRRQLYQKKGILNRLRLRYWYAVELPGPGR